MKPGWPETLRIVAALSLFYPFKAVPSDIYTWKDADGVVHFSEHEPRMGGARQVEPAAPVLVPMNDNLEAAEAITEMLATPEPAESGRSPADLESRDRKRRCDRYRQQLNNIQSQLRAGYSNARGNRLRERRRSLNRKLGRECILG